VKSGVKAALSKAWGARAPRERMVIAALAAVLGAASYLWLLYSADRGRAQLRASVATLRTQAALLDQQAADYERLRAIPPPAASPTDLRALVQARIDAARLSGALTRLEAPDADHVRVAFGAVSFADWLGWLAALQAQRVSLEAARVEALSAPGMVSATATLARARAQ
jgi:general secretion pathway protein M